MSDLIIRHAVCDLCDNEAEGTKEELISKGWFMGMMGESCPDHGPEQKPELGTFWKPADCEDWPDVIGTDATNLQPTTQNEDPAD